MPRGTSDSFGDNLAKVMQQLSLALMAVDATEEDQAFIQGLQTAIIQHNQQQAAVAGGMGGMGTAGMGIQSGTGTGASVNLPGVTGGEPLSRSAMPTPGDQAGMTEELSRVMQGS